MPGDVGQARRRRTRRRRLLTTAFSLSCHAGLLAALLLVHPPPLTPPEPEPMVVALVDPRPPAATPAPGSAPAPPAAAQPPPPKNLARKTPPRPDVKPLPAGEGEAQDAGVELSDAQLASAAPAGGGGGGSGRPCDMARRLQAALRRDARVQAAVADARAAGLGSKALFVWNGDWIRSSGQEGNGLAAVREAMMWEIGFAPEACRAEPVHGLVAFSLNDSPGGARLVVGAGAWHWTDLLRPRAGG